ncbi:hypothetical protein MA16_Dca005055 [Dendrobium catenatum]|uniref:Uncharacterized protein n=1 Tax=Dendrobium catenatum TaxID=906689 RepID=A0A2I0WGS0_9ASPA|nr:hypothetical protein MA16_Dca005055 [Dendrobium catenatum]
MGSRPSVALVLVELDITKIYLDVVWIGPDNLGYAQSIMMENLPFFCDQCEALGHANNEYGYTAVNIINYDGNVNGVLEYVVNISTPNLSLVSHVNVLVANGGDCIEASIDFVKIYGDLHIGDKDSNIEEEMVPSNTALHFSVKVVNDGLGANICGVNLAATPIASPCISVGDGADGDSAFDHSGVNFSPCGMEPGRVMVLMVLPWLFRIQNCFPLLRICLLMFRFLLFQLRL